MEGNTGTNPSNEMVLQDGGTYYLAVFNFETSAVTDAVHLGRAGLSATQTYTVTDLWTGGTSTAQGTLSVALDAESPKLFELK